MGQYSYTVILFVSRYFDVYASEVATTMMDRVEGHSFYQ